MPAHQKFIWSGVFFEMLLVGSPETPETVLITFTRNV